MKKHCSLILLSGVLMFATSCQETATEKTDHNTMGDTVATATAFDMNKAKAWIESDNAKFSEEAKKGDSNALAAHYASDGWAMFDNSEPFKGAAIANAWGGAIRSGMKELKITTVDLTGNAELLVETGMYEMIGDGNKTLDKGKYLVVWKPEGDGWKIYRDIGNSNMAPHK